MDQFVTIAQSKELLFTFHSLPLDKLLDNVCLYSYFFIDIVKYGS